MAKFIYNTRQYALLFKAGNLEVYPGKYKAVTENDFLSGIFEQEILRGDLLVFDKEQDVPGVMPAPAPAPVQNLVGGMEPGATNEELLAFLAEQKAKAERDANKYVRAAEPAKIETVPEPEPETEPKVVKPRVKKTPPVVEPVTSTPETETV